MARSPSENCTGTVLRAFGVAIRGQSLDFRCGQVIGVDGQVREAIDMAGAPVAWDGEVPPHSSTLSVGEHGLPPGLY